MVSSPAQFGFPTLGQFRKQQGAVISLNLDNTNIDSATASTTLLELLHQNMISSLSDFYPKR
jgi:hypothetical protein